MRPILSGLAAALLATSTAASTAGAQDTFDIVAELDVGLGNIAITPDNRIILSLHQFYEPEFRVVELTEDGTTVPFPNAAWASAPDAQGIGLQGVLGLRADADGVVWLLDNGIGGAVAPRVVAWDTEANALYRIIHLPPPVTVESSFANDLAIDSRHGQVIIADTAAESPALIVVDVDTGLARRVLADHPSMRAEDVDMVVEGAVVAPGGEPARIPINPITIDAESTWVYYGAMNGTALYRIPTAALADPDLDDAALAETIERYGDKPVSDGITMDDAGNVYITDLGADAIGAVRPDGSYAVLFQDARLSWPDGMSVAPDGSIYVTVNQLHRSAPLAGGEDRSEPPYLLIRFTPLAPATIGR